MGEWVMGSELPKVIGRGVHQRLQPVAPRIGRGGLGEVGDNPQLVVAGRLFRPEVPGLEGGGLVFPLRLSGGLESGACNGPFYGRVMAALSGR